MQLWRFTAFIARVLHRTDTNWSPYVPMYNSAGEWDDDDTACAKIMFSRTMPKLYPNAFARLRNYILFSNWKFFDCRNFSILGWGRIVQMRQEELFVTGAQWLDKGWTTKMTMLIADINCQSLIMLSFWKELSLFSESLLCSFVC